MALSVLYAPVAYSSARGFGEVLPSLPFSNSYALAKRTAVVAPPLSVKVITRFVCQDSIAPTLDSLTQMEFLDAEAARPDILKMYQKAFYKEKLGRVSLVPNGRMTHNVASQLEHITKSVELGIQISEMLQQVQGLPSEDGKLLVDRLTQFQDNLALFGELRKNNGFTAQENVVYGRLFILNSLFGRMYLGKALAEPTTGKSAVDALRSGAELVELLLALQTARLSEEADTGPNYPIELKRLSLRDILVR